MESTQVVSIPTTNAPTLVHTSPTSLPDHTQLPDSDGTFVKNFQEHPQSLILTSSIEPVLQKLHPDGRYCIGQDSGIYWTLTEPPEKGAEAPDWFYVGNVSPLLQGKYRRSYVMWNEVVPPLLAIEFVSGNGAEERDASPPPEHDEIDPKTGKKRKAGKFWVYEQAVKIPFYAIYEVSKAAVAVYQLVDQRYRLIEPNIRGHYSIPPMGIELGILYGNEEFPVPWLRFWDADGNLLLTGDERAVMEMNARLRAELAADRASLAQQQAEKSAVQERLAKQQAERGQQQAELAQKLAEQKAQRLAEMLEAMGIDPEQI
jgi:Uma2 family endonuclease